MLNLYKKYSIVKFCARKYAEVNWVKKNKKDYYASEW